LNTAGFETTLFPLWCVNARGVFSEWMGITCRRFDAGLYTSSTGEPLFMSTALSFYLTPELTGETLLLRPLQADDFDALYAVAADPQI
jgi:hypothetical protein